MRDLEKVRGLKILHRDISPRNIILKENYLCLIDWGYAIEVKDDTEKLHYSGTMLFASDVVLERFGEKEFGEVFIEIKYEDDVESLLKVFCCMMVPQAMYKLDCVYQETSDNKLPLPSVILTIWKEIWELPGSSIFSSLRGKSYNEIASVLEKIKRID